MKTKLNFLKSTSSDSRSRPIIVLIPGGPGLSSKTLKGLEILNRSFDLALIDPPGTGGQNEPKKQSFDLVLNSIEEVLKIINRPMILLAHSFGGLKAAKLIKRGNLNCVGVILLATPFLKETFDGIDAQYKKFKNSEIKQAESKWQENKSLETMKNWFASYGLLFFTEDTIEAGRQLLLNDQMSLSAFLGLRNEVIDGKNLLQEFKKVSIPKIFIAGEKDNLIPTALLKRDAQAGYFEFHILKNTGHFINLNQSEAVARLIEKKFIDSKKGENL